MKQSIFVAGHQLIGRSELENEDGSKETQRICSCSIKTFCSTQGSKRHIIDPSALIQGAAIPIFSAHIIYDHIMTISQDQTAEMYCKNKIAVMNPSVETVPRCISTFSGLKSTMAQ